MAMTTITKQRYTLPEEVEYKSHVFYEDNGVNSYFFRTPTLGNVRVDVRSDDTAVVWSTFWHKEAAGRNDIFYDRFTLPESARMVVPFLKDYLLREDILHRDELDYYYSTKASA